MAGFVTLDVGGKIYSTAYSTLSKCHYFRAKISPSQNFYKIDRDGEMFRHVLNFLRFRKLVLPEAFTDFELLQAEANFFEIDELSWELSNALKDKSCIPQVIGLNVGGKVYWVSKDILEKCNPNSVFKDILLNPNYFAKDEEGNYHIDQDGEVFQYVFNFLKSGNLGLPEGFDEFELLKRQAQFFKLKELEDFVKFEEVVIRRRRVKTVGFVINGQVFRLRREDVLREERSVFFSIMLGTVPTPMDAQGNFIIEKSAENANNLMHYISHGSISKTMTSNEVKQLKDDASRFGVSRLVLETHFKTMQFMRYITSDIHLRIIHFLQHPTCNIAYFNKKPHDNFLGKTLEIDEVLIEDSAVFVGKINIEELKRKDEKLKSIEADDIASSICRITGLTQTEVYPTGGRDTSLYYRMCQPPYHTLLEFCRGLKS